MAPNKKDLLGSGVAGILGVGPAAPAAPAKKTAAAAKQPVIKEKPADDYYQYRRGRPRRDSDRAAFAEGKTFVATSLWLEEAQYRRVREMAEDRRVSIKEMMYHLIEAGITGLEGGGRKG
jgi:hypothetical protein